MIKKINTDQIRPGMFIHDLNAGWLSHPFISNTIKVDDYETVDKIVTCGIREVYIDTEKGLDVGGASGEEVIQGKKSGRGRAAGKGLGNIAQVPVQEELIKAREIQREAKKTVQSVMDDVRFGRQIQTEKVEHVVENMVESIFRNQDALLSLGRIRKMDEYTYYHSMSACALMVSFARQMKFDPQVIHEVGVGAMLHDVGKMKVPPEILNGRGKLTNEEYEIIKGHVLHGNAILEETKGLTDTSIVMCAEHHERINGSGYPHKLKGDDISVFGQMSAIVDVYDAMTSDRCYQNKLNPSEVLKKLFEWSTSHFNKELVQRFIRCVGIYPIGTLVLLKSGMLAVVINHGEKDMLKPVVRVILNTQSKTRLVPYDLDLSANGDSVERYEAPEKWGINPVTYL